MIRIFQKVIKFFKLKINYLRNKNTFFFFINILKSIIFCKNILQILRLWLLNFPENNITNITKKIISLDIKSDLYYVHGVYSIEGAISLKKKYNSKLLIDLIEHPSLLTRESIVTNKKFYLKKLKKFEIETFQNINQSDHIFTIGKSMKKLLSNKIKKKITVIMNYPRKRFIKKINKKNIFYSIRKKNPNAIIGIINNTVSYGMKELIEITKKNNNLHFVIIGELFPDEYFIKITQLIVKNKLIKNFHFINPVPYNFFPSLATNADYGLILRNTKIINVKYSLPNRIFDLIHSNLPILTCNIIDIVKIVKKNHIGLIDDFKNPDKTIAKISYIQNKNKTFRDNCSILKKKLSWINNERYIFRVLNDKKIKKITIITHINSKNNQRIQRLIKSFKKNNKKVSIIDLEVMKNTKCIKK